MGGKQQCPAAVQGNTWMPCERQHQQFSLVFLSYADMSTVDRMKVTAESCKYDVKRGYSISQYQDTLQEHKF